MLGFLRKDLYMLYRAYGKNLLVIFLMYAAMVVFMKNTFILAIVIWLMSFYSLSAITMDDSCGWDRFARTLPVSSGTIVLARFLTSLVMLGTGLAFAAVTAVILCCFMDYGDIGPLMVMIAVVTALTLATSGVLLPAAYKWGVEKVRNTAVLVFALMSVSPFMLRKWIGNDFIAGLKRWLSELSLVSLSVWALAAGLLIFAFGGWLSGRIYAKKEF